MLVPLPDPALATKLYLKAFILYVNLFGKDPSKVQHDNSGKSSSPLTRFHTAEQVLHWKHSVLRRLILNTYFYLHCNNLELFFKYRSPFVDDIYLRATPASDDTLRL